MHEKSGLRRASFIHQQQYKTKQSGGLVKKGQNGLPELLLQFKTKLVYQN